MITLYPTETVYGLGVSVFDDAELQRLREIKGGREGKLESWLVKDIAQLEKYGVLSNAAQRLAEQLLPGPLTLVLAARPEARRGIWKDVEYIGFRISSDPFAQKLIQHSDVPLTCTSANVGGMPTRSTPQEILAQFGANASQIDQVIDDGPREGDASTVVKVVGDTVEILREGAISAEEINRLLM